MPSPKSKEDEDKKGLCNKLMFFMYEKKQPLQNRGTGAVGEDINPTLTVAKIEIIFLISKFFMLKLWQMRKIWAESLPK